MPTVDQEYEVPIHKRVMGNLKEYGIILNEMQALQILYGTVQGLNNPLVLECIKNKSISVDQVLNISWDATEALKNPLVVDNINNGTVSIIQVFNISVYARQALEIPLVVDNINNGVIKVNEVLNVTMYGISNLNDTDICELINRNVIDLIQVINSTHILTAVLKHSKMRKLIVNGIIRKDQVLQITETFYRFLVMLLAFNGLSDKLFENNHVDMSRILQLDVARLDEIEDVFIKLIRSLLGLAEQDVLPENIDELLEQQDQIPIELLEENVNIIVNIINRPLIEVKNINYRQSTHNSLVEQSCLRSANKLLEYYGAQIKDEKQLQSILERLKEDINKLPEPLDNAIKYQAAKRCLDRILAADDNFIHPQSQITIKQLLALTFLAICDDSKRTSGVTVKEAIEVLASGLHEIQRGNNLDAEGKDSGVGIDDPICEGGTFNKLIEKLVGIHPACEISFITGNIVALRLMVVIKQKVIECLTKRANIQNQEEYIRFTGLVNKIKAGENEDEEGIDGGLGVIYDDIKCQIIDCMFEEFGGIFYKSKEDPKLIEAIDSSYKYVLLSKEELEQLQQKAQDSLSRQQPYKHNGSPLLFNNGSHHANVGSTSFLLEQDNSSNSDKEMRNRQINTSPTGFEPVLSP